MTRQQMIEILRDECNMNEKYLKQLSDESLCSLVRKWGYDPELKAAVDQAFAPAGL